VLTSRDGEELGTIGATAREREQAVLGAQTRLPKVLAAGVGESPRWQLAGQSPCGDYTARCRGATAMNVKDRIFSLYSHMIGFVARLVIYNLTEVITSSR
jgi:hypothetical protein